MLNNKNLAPCHGFLVLFTRKVSFYAAFSQAFIFIEFCAFFSFYVGEEMATCSKTLTIDGLGASLNSGIWKIKDNQCVLEIGKLHKMAKSYLITEGIKVFLINWITPDLVVLSGRIRP